MAHLTFAHRYVPPMGEATRTLLLLHGAGGNENDLLSLGAELAPQAGLLSPRGKVLENGLPHFFRRWAEGVFDPDDVRLRTSELAEFVALASVRYRFDREQVIGVGYSNGACTAASLLLHSPDTLCAAALLHVTTPILPDVLPNLAGKKVFLGARENDPIAPREESMRLAELILRCGAEVATAWFVHGHQLSASEVKAVTEWLERL